jgi:hypothetical protein
LAYYVYVKISNFDRIFISVIPVYYMVKPPYILLPFIFNNLNLLPKFLSTRYKYNLCVVYSAVDWQ